MTYLRNFMVKYFEEPFLKSELHRAQPNAKTMVKKGYQEELAGSLVKNYRAFQNWECR